jgi:competence protein ComFB
MMLNAIEEVISSVYADLLKTHAEFCSCERCRDDVQTMALNQAKPRYVVGDPLGAAVTRVALSQDQIRAEIAVIVFEAMRKVSQIPRHTSEYRRFSGGMPKG